MSADVSQLIKLGQDLKRVPDRIGELAEAVVLKTGADIEATMKSLAPVDTGNLRNSIGTDIDGGASGGSVLASIGPTASYAVFQEYGTSRMAPQSFAGPAFDQHVPGFIAAMEQVVDKAFR